MSDLVANPEDRFSHNGAHMSLVTRKLIVSVSDQLGLKASCTHDQSATEDGYKPAIMD